VDPGAQRAGEGHDRSEVRKREAHDRRPLADERALHRLHVAGHGLRVEAGPKEVVGAGDHEGEVRPHGESRAELLVEHLANGAAPHGEVGVEERPLLEGDPLGQAVGPPAITPSPVGIVEPFGRAVAHCDVALEEPQTGGQPPNLGG
jgi:hypothetical protein